MKCYKKIGKEKDMINTNHYNLLIENYLKIL